MSTTFQLETGGNNGRGAAFFVIFVPQNTFSAGEFAPWEAKRKTKEVARGHSLRLFLTRGYTRYAEFRRTAK